jgi:hypothetical protein
MAVAVAQERPLPLHLLISPAIIEATPRFVQNELGAAEGALLPKLALTDTDCRFQSSDETDGSVYKTDTPSSRTPITPAEQRGQFRLAIEWEILVFQALRKAAFGQMTATVPAILFDDVAKYVKAQVKWPMDEVYRKEALNATISQLTTPEHTNGFKVVLHGHDGNRKEFIKLFIGLVQPEPFHTRVKGIVNKRKEKTFDGVCDIIFEMGELYEDIMMYDLTAFIDHIPNEPSDEHGGKTMQCTPLTVLMLNYRDVRFTL